MTAKAYDYGLGTVWQEVHVERRAAYSTSVTDYHEHAFYEINLILSGNVSILLGECAEQCTGSRVVLTRPGTPHYIACRPDTLYSRLYLVFTREFVEDRLPEWRHLCEVFGEGGAILAPDAAQTEALRTLIEQIDREPSALRKRLLTYYLLSRLGELSGTSARRPHRIPPYILEAIAYLEKHHSEHITARTLADRLHIGRTTLMTEFKAHTGATVGEYLTRCRLRAAVRLLDEGGTLESTATLCGYSDTSGLIRAFRRCYGMTPREYVKSLT